MAHGAITGQLSNIMTALRGYSAYEIAKQLGETKTEREWLESLSYNPTARVTTLDGTPLASGTVIEAVGIPVYVDDVAEYEEYSLTEAGWYIFARITAPAGVTVTEETVVEGVIGCIKEEGADYVDVAIGFAVAAISQVVTVEWSEEITDTFVFKATDLGIRNLDRLTTFYVYDIARFTTWEYTLTTDAEFVAGTHYYTLGEDGAYTLAEVTTGDTVPADTYYVHSKVRFEGMARNVTYRCDTIIDCPMEFVLPAIEDETHGAWFEIRCRHAGAYSMTLVPSEEGVKIATEHTQKETAGINMINLHYTVVDGVKIWRFMNTHSTIQE